MFGDFAIDIFNISIAHEKYVSVYICVLKEKAEINSDNWEWNKNITRLHAYYSPNKQ